MTVAPALRHGDRSVRLKWHQLRRHATDPAHHRTNLERGITEGASLEVDVVATRDGHWICLHDDELAAETTGRGSVHDHDRAEIERLRQRDDAGREQPSAPLFLDELLATLAGAPADWRGSLQLDLKQPFERLGPPLVERFAALVGPVARHVVLGGTEWPALTTLAKAVPGLRVGFDPLAIHEAAPPTTAVAFQALGAYMLATTPRVAIYYLHIPTVLRGLDLGVDLIAMARTSGAEVDAWRLEPEGDRAEATMLRLLAAGVDQITTNSPAVWAEWEERRA
jgi:glycerophosphoryl diester phosphodiesterase